ncbi:PepSY-associated TM helix domain protein OS=Chthoniobacter flavus Ellin428 GN=CfE428DRAFT_6259 PE=4 SV=1: PepSY_TM_1: PepSY_TM_1 [Gemmata massiliana]|uniref:Peptidase n=1 Tax=Gemmata massiliana TaxID=1210884 RepID=A0A6P2CSF9_9BACT|nr:PepSY-associated TM helix domain-containing protein [Gemmata massiliana]VTR91296.1 PepSY-associated TM helix domain protein OS=Chthoniobacter flavus Ellin428 GN=CfE428DRAFT_6259 PE=4 SV=1: PepSY_TM_1: PepSY_TM_1 [Gemmata massiliana]
MSPLHRWILKTSRTVHVYLTLFGLTLILFFAVTGFMLNHTEWFLPDDAKLEAQTRRESRPLPLDKMPGGKLPVPSESSGEATGEEKLAVVEALRKEFDVRGELSSFVFVKDDNDRPQIKVEFKRAGGETVATIDVESATTEVASTYQGWAIVMTDLHRGNRGNMSNEVKRTGRVWSFVIDGTCVLLLIISATGLVMWWSLKSRGKWGAILFVIGTAITGAVYYWFVP